MRLDDFLDVLRAEFAQAADDIDGRLAQWIGDDPQQAPGHAEAVVSILDRLASVARMVSLEGQALALEQLRDAAQLTALSGPDEMAAGVGWLALWREPMASAFERPGDAAMAAALVEHLGSGPMPLPADAAAQLSSLLQHGPELPVDDVDSQIAALAPPEAQDVSIAPPADVDAALLETFLADAPDQLALMGETIRALSRGTVDPARLIEAQRVAHTFKGSGNIIGIRGVGRLAHRMEDLLEFAVAQGGALPAPMARDLERAAGTLDQMVYALRGEEPEPTDALRDLTVLTDWARAIDDGSWPDRVGEAAARGTAPVAGLPAAASAAPAEPSTPRPADGEAQIRVGAGRIDRVVRRAGQHLVQHGRLVDQVRQLEARLAGLIQNQRALDARMRELQAHVDRQGVSLKTKAETEGETFDPLEMDRYDELHLLARFAAELVADGLDHAVSANEDTRAAAAGLAELERTLKAQHGDLLGTRMLPFRHIAPRLRRNVSQTAAVTGKPVQLLVEGETVQLDGDVLERLTEPLLHLLRNAVDHGIEPPEERALLGKPAEGTVRLVVQREGQTLRIDCRDDGRGLDLGAIHAKAVALGLLAADADVDPDTLARTILLPGFSTRDAVTDVSGRGVGMDVVAERIRAMKGRLEIATEAFAGSTFTIRVPATTGSVHALVVEVSGQRFAIPTDEVVTGVAAAQAMVTDGRLRVDDRDWRCLPLAPALGLADRTGADARRPAVVVRAGDEEVALQVDRVVETRELILQDVGRLLLRVRGVAGGALRPDGRVMLVLDPEALLGQQTVVQADAARALRERMRAERRRVLVVDDSHSVRKSLSQLLGDAGYEVLMARDGFEALEQLARGRTDLVLTDLEMPNLNGLDLTRRLRAGDETRRTPVVMITSRSNDKHRERAVEAGVDVYLTKPYTDLDLLGRVRELLAA